MNLGTLICWHSTLLNLLVAHVSLSGIRFFTLSFFRYFYMQLQPTFPPRKSCIEEMFALANMQLRDHVDTQLMKHFMR